jgi:hypothetical protein
MPLPERNCNQNLETLPARDKSHVDLSASLHLRAGGLTAGVLPDAFARKKLKSKFRNTYRPTTRATFNLALLRIQVQAG